MLNLALRLTVLVILFSAFTLNLLAQVGIGTATPSSKLEVVGAGTTSAATALKVGNASSTIFSVRNDGLIEMASTTQGFLPPRMTASQRVAIINPAQGLVLFCTDCGSTGELQLFNGATWVNMAGGPVAPVFSCGSSSVTFTYKGASVTYGTVSGANSKCWLDRNLGAQQVATSLTDHLSYGDLFQWGRGDDGHQSVTWTNSTSGTGTAITTTLSGTDNPGHSNFISASASPYDWRTTANDNLWQGVSGTNNVCPSGWRLPTETELQAEINTWSSGSNSREKAFNSVLKLPLSGTRSSNESSTQVYAGTSPYSIVYYLWTSTVSGNTSMALIVLSGSSTFGFHSQHRAYGYTVRCIKN